MNGRCAQPIKTMKICAFTLILILFSLPSIGQKNISTQQIESVAVRFGVDSALRIIQPFIDIY